MKLIPCHLIERGVFSLRLVVPNNFCNIHNNNGRKITMQNAMKVKNNMMSRFILYIVDILLLSAMFHTYVWGVLVFTFLFILFIYILITYLISLHELLYSLKPPFEIWFWIAQFSGTIFLIMCETLEAVRFHIRSPPDVKSTSSTSLRCRIYIGSTSDLRRRLIALI